MQVVPVGGTMIVASILRTTPFNPFILINPTRMNHSFHSSNAIAAMSKVHPNNPIRHLILSVFYPSLMRAAHLSVESEAALFQEIRDVVITPIVQSSRHGLPE
jgi:hypothetical protein